MEDPRVCTENFPYFDSRRSALANGAKIELRRIPYSKLG
jgi:hypothetical protein